ncbi:MAG: four helix bundle protein, partial [Pirellulaceae bacterium]
DLLQPRRDPWSLEEKLIKFAVQTISVVEALPQSKASRHIAQQLVRCGTSPAANYGEAQAAESRKGFVHKMKVALKELRESLVWLRIIQSKSLGEDALVARIAGDCDELVAIFVVSIRTAEHNMGRAIKRDEL